MSILGQEALLGVNFNKRHGLETAPREPRTGDERQTLQRNRERDTDVTISLRRILTGDMRTLRNVDIAACEIQTGDMASPRPPNRASIKVSTAMSVDAPDMTFPNIVHLRDCSRDFQFHAIHFTMQDRFSIPRKVTCHQSLYIACNITRQKSRQSTRHIARQKTLYISRQITYQGTLQITHNMTRQIPRQITRLVI